MGELDLKSPFSPREQKILEVYERMGVRPLSPVLVSQFYQMFLESYSCAQIAESNRSKGVSEGDILYAAKKFDWHSKRDQYASDLHTQIHQKIAKAELEAIEHITNMLSITHKRERDQMIKYMQTGKEEDLPSNMPTTLKQYKDLIDLFQKSTGKDKITKQEIKTETKTTFAIDESTRQSISADDQKKLLASMLAEQEGKKK